MSVKYYQKCQWIIYFSFLFSVFFQIIPWPNRIEVYRPNWVLLVLLYWTFMLPYRVNIGTGFLMGSVLDLIGASTLGLRALSMSIIAYLATTKSHLFQHLAYWQQVPVIILLSITENIIIFWIEFLVIGMSFRPILCWSSIINGIIWPWLCLLMKKIYQ